MTYSGPTIDFNTRAALKACYDDDAKEFIACLKNGIDIFAEDDGKMAFAEYAVAGNNFLHIAGRHANLNILKAVFAELKKFDQEDVTTMVNSRNNLFETPLMAAAEGFEYHDEIRGDRYGRQNFAVVQEICADIDAEEYLERQAARTIELLLQNGADKTLTDELYRTAAMRAAENYHTKRLDVLTKKGSDMADDQHQAYINYQSILTLDTALHLACASGATSNIELLMERGANPCLENERGQDCFDVLKEFAQNAHIGSNSATYKEMKSILSGQNIVASQSKAEGARRVLMALSLQKA